MSRNARRARSVTVIGAIAFCLISFHAIAAPAHCKLVRTGQQWQGSCPGLNGQTPTMTVSAAGTVKTGRYRRDVTPLAVLTGEMQTRAGALQLEIEFYADGSGNFRREGLPWLQTANVAIGKDLVEFDLDLEKTVPPSDLDREIIVRAAAILASDAVWDRADDRQCDPADKTWSIYCAMIRATLEVTGGIHHRRPAMELVRQVVDERSAGRQYEHRLRDYNNDPATRLSDVQSLFKEALARLKR